MHCIQLGIFTNNHKINAYLIAWLLSMMMPGTTMIWNNNYYYYYNVYNYYTQLTPTECTLFLPCRGLRWSETTTTTTTMSTTTTPSWHPQSVRYSCHVGDYNDLKQQLLLLLQRIRDFLTMRYINPHLIWFDLITTTSTTTRPGWHTTLILNITTSTAKSIRSHQCNAWHLY